MEKFGKPTWRRLVEAVKSNAGGNNPALAQTIAEDHPGEPGNLIHQFAKLCGRSSYLYTVLCLNLVEQCTYTDVPRVTSNIQKGFPCNEYSHIHLYLCVLPF